MQLPAQPFRKAWQYKLLTFYPPFIGAGIYVRSVSSDLTRIEAVLPLRWYNRNAYGAHFGGNIYMLCDPFFILILHAWLGEDYVLWDRSAQIRYLKPGRGRLSAIFEITKPRIQHIIDQLEKNPQSSFHFSTEVKNKHGETVATVEKEIYIRKK